MIKIRGYRERERVPTAVGEVSRTKQAFKEDSDINAIMRKYKATGHLPERPGAPRYGDFSNVDDYLDAVNRVRAAQEVFDSLPAHIRDHVGNDPAGLLALVYDPGRVDEMQQLGLLPPDPPEPPAPAPAPASPSEPPAAPEPPAPAPGAEPPTS